MRGKSKVWKIKPKIVENVYRSEENSRLDRDIVGELSAAVRHVGLKYGLYYSGGLDWSFPGSLDGHCKEKIENLLYIVKYKNGIKNYSLLIIYYLY